jgi:hypothetical protein
LPPLLKQNVCAVEESTQKVRKKDKITVKNPTLVHRLKNPALCLSQKRKIEQAEKRMQEKEDEAIREA